MRKWQFNRKFLYEAINSGQRFLSDENLSKRERLEITSDIKKFQKFINGDFENNQRKRKLNFKTVKKIILNSMQKYQILFSKDLRMWFVELSQTRIFDYSKEIPTFTLSIDEQVNETLANYRDNYPVFYSCAKEILTNKNAQLVQEATPNSSSYCFYSDILHLPFIVIDPSDEAYVLNHEIEHGIEYLMGISTHELYSEFGPMYFESSFNDRIYKKYGKQALSGPLNRIKDTKELLTIISIYFYAMNIFSHYNFDIDDDLFIKVFEDATRLEKEDLLAFLNEEMIDSEISETLGYLFSFLKTIEIRDYLIRGNDKGNNMFNDILFNKRFRFTPPEDGFGPYIRFVNEAKQKMR